METILQVKQIEKIDGSSEAKITYLYQDMPVGTVTAEVEDVFASNQTVRVAAKTSEESGKNSGSGSSQWMRTFAATLAACIVLVIVMMTVLSVRRERKRLEARRKRRKN